MKQFWESQILFINTSCSFILVNNICGPAMVLLCLFVGFRQDSLLKTSKLGRWPLCNDLCMESEFIDEVRFHLLIHYFLKRDCD